MLQLQFGCAGAYTVSGGKGIDLHFIESKKALEVVERGRGWCAREDSNF